MPDMPCASIQEATSMQCTNGAEDIEEVCPGDMGPSGMIADAGGQISYLVGRLIYLQGQEEKFWCSLCLPR